MMVYCIGIVQYINSRIFVVFKLSTLQEDLEMSINMFGSVYFAIIFRVVREHLSKDFP